MMTDRSISAAAVIVLTAVKAGTVLVIAVIVVVIAVTGVKAGNVLMIAGIVVVIDLNAVKTGNVLVIVVDMAKIATNVAKIAAVIVPHSKIQNPRKSIQWSHRFRWNLRLFRTRLLTL